MAPATAARVLSAPSPLGHGGRCRVTGPAVTVAGRFGDRRTATAGPAAPSST